MDEVQAECESIIITKHGKPVAKLVPINSKRDDFYDFMEGKAEILGDIASPIIPEGKWNLV